VPVGHSHNRVITALHPAQPTVLPVAHRTASLWRGMASWFGNHGAGRGRCCLSAIRSRGHSIGRAGPRRTQSPTTGSRVRPGWRTSPRCGPSSSGSCGWRRERRRPAERQHQMSNFTRCSKLAVCRGSREPDLTRISGRCPGERAGGSALGSVQLGRFWRDLRPAADLRAA
jgi:hypothetical protein